MQTILGPDHDLAKRISKLEQDVASLNTRDVLQNASIGAGGLLVYGGGSITIKDGGQVIVSGIQLSGVTAGSSWANSSTAFSVNTAEQTVASCQVPVPGGYTQAIITANAISQAQCDSATDYFTVKVVINASSTGQVSHVYADPVMCQSNAGTVPGAVVYPQNTVQNIQTFAGLSGGAIGASVAVNSQSYSWASSSVNSATIQLSVIFLA